MQLQLVVIGKTDSAHVQALLQDYTRRLEHYAPFSIKIIPDVGRGGVEKEGERILLEVNASDYVALLDENGEEYTSIELSQWLQKRLNSGRRRLVLVIGGPFGFSEAVYARADARLSLSRLTFSHQMVRPIAVEAIYRAFTILKGEPYHHA